MWRTSQFAGPDEWLAGRPAAAQRVGATAVELGRPAASAVFAEDGLEAPLLGPAGARCERLRGLLVEGRGDLRGAAPLGHAEDDDGAHHAADPHLDQVVRAHVAG